MRGQSSSRRVAAKRLNGSRRLRRAHEIQDLRSAPAIAAWLWERALANTSRSAIFSRQARALFKLLLKNAFGLEVALQGDDRKKLLDSFDVLYKHLRGSRAAVYALS